MNDAALFDQLPVYPLENVHIPALILQGSADQSVPLVHAEFAANTIPNAELVMIEGGGHGMSTFTPEAKARVSAFLDQHAAK
jgi:pimeloyl-ACP methyl ester carboxylesterase